jgi:hypothetical protein
VHTDRFSDDAPSLKVEDRFNVIERSTTLSRIEAGTRFSTQSLHFFRIQNFTAIGNESRTIRTGLEVVDENQDPIALKFLEFL